MNKLSVWKRKVAKEEKKRAFYNQDLSMLWQKYHSLEW